MHLTISREKPSGQRLYCEYYQAEIVREKCWFVAAIIRGHEHIAFDRTIDVEASRFEFFVPIDMEEAFLAIINELVDLQLVHNLKKLPNRFLLDEHRGENLQSPE